MSSDKPKSIVVFGLGEHAFKHAPPTLSSLPGLFKIVAGCDPNEGARMRFTQLLPLTPVLSKVEEILILRHSLGTRFDCAYVAVPHSEHDEIVRKLLQAGVHVLKEKPASITRQQLLEYQNLAQRNNVRLSTAVQMRHSNYPVELRAWLPFIGSVRFLEGVREICCSDFGQGWRAQHAISGGGVLRDLGWHLLDLILDLLEGSKSPVVNHSEVILTRPHQKYDVEDTAFIAMVLPGSAKERDISCHIKISRAGHNKVNRIAFTGSNGTLIANCNGSKLHLDLISTTKSFTKTFTDSVDPFRKMFQAFRDEISAGKPSVTYIKHAERDMKVVGLVQGIYEREGRQNQLSEALAHKTGTHHLQDELVTPYRPPLHMDRGKQYEWPVLTSDVLEDVMDQLNDTLSIYGSNGVFGEFEDEFKRMLNQPSWFSLLHNSGSNALSALYFSCGLQPGDEVLFPVYGFHATTSPAMHFGILPVFVDTDCSGNMSSTALEAALTSNTKAIMVTYMWGIPCDMNAILAVLRRHPGLLLLEDCSHAHDAKFGGQPVGTFGDGAAWSLQGQKIISGGEGSIMVTKHHEFHVRALIWGHYNKRCLSEIPEDHSLAPYSLTGAGCKHRAHPVAIKIALNQLRKLTSFTRFKSMYAAQFAEALEKIPFLELPQISSLEQRQREHTRPAWYAFWVRFKQSLAPKGLTREKFVQGLREFGLEEIDIPKSTCLLHGEPLYTSPHKIFPFLYTEKSLQSHPSEDSFPIARSFHYEIIKFPVWATAQDQRMVDFYIRGFVEVASEYTKQA